MEREKFKSTCDSLPNKRKRVLWGLLHGDTREKIMADVGISEAALTQHKRQLYKNFQIDIFQNEADDPRSGERKLPQLIALFARYMPELVSPTRPSSTPSLTSVSSNTGFNCDDIKFELKIENQLDGRISRTLTLGTSNEVLWDFIQFPKGNYSIKAISHNDALIVSNFGGKNILIIDPKERKVIDSIELDHYDASHLALPTEQRKFGNAPVIRKYPPGDIIVVNDKLFVGQVFSEFVLVIDLHSKVIIKRLAIGGEGKFMSSPQGDKVFFASNQSNAFFIINPLTYKVESVQYPEPELHTGAIFCNPESQLLYLGLHRTRRRDSKRYSGANSYIPIYDISKNEYVSEINLVIDENDEIERSWSASMVYSSEEKLLYTAMLGASKGIYLIDTEKNKIVGNIKIEPNPSNKHEHVDCLSQALYQNYLLSINRSNYELAVIDRKSKQKAIAIPLGGTGNGPQDVCVVSDKAYISHSEYEGLIVVDLQKIIALIQLKS